jgi:hypothetical protein
MKTADFLSVADQLLEPSLAIAGFQRTSAGKWNRCTGEELHAVWLQKHSVDSSFCVNLGVHYSFLEKSGSTERPSGGIVDQTECRIMLRLTAEPTAKDQWWPLSEQGIHEVRSLFDSRGFAIFDSYRLSGPIAAIEVKEIEDGTPGLLSSMTKAGACLLLACIHEHLGNREKCMEAATVGLKHVGMAVGAKKALKDILKRNGEPA